MKIFYYLSLFKASSIVIILVLYFSSENDEYSPEEEKRIEEILFQIRSLVRRTDIEIENLAKLDEEHRALKKRQVKIYNLLKK